MKFGETLKIIKFNFNENKTSYAALDVDLRSWRNFDPLNLSGADLENYFGRENSKHFQRLTFVFLIGKNVIFQHFPRLEGEILPL